MMNAFDELHPLVARLAKERFERPTEIQELAIPHVLKGENVLVIAGTGMGKTEAVMLPIFSKLLSEPKKIGVLYITPLRALNRDMFSRLFWWGDKLDLEIAIRHGDTLIRERREQRETPPHVLITTPESLQAILVGKEMRKHLKEVRCVVVDEIHELVESKRGVQLNLALIRLELLAGKFQRIGLSATIGSPEEVAKWLGEGVRILESKSARKYEIKLHFPRPRLETAILASEINVSKEVAARLESIAEIVKEFDSTIIFTNTREMAELLGSRLRLYDEELKVAVHHSSISRSGRIRTEHAFKAGELNAIVATSSLELGIDIGVVDYVIQYCSPRQVTKLLQRIGRSSHRVGEVAKGIIIATESDLHECLAIVELAKKGKLERTNVLKESLDVLAHQIVGFLLEYEELNKTDLLNWIRRSYCYRDLAFTELEEILEFLAKHRLISVDEFGRIKRKARAWDYYFENLSTIPDEKQYPMIDIATGETVAKLSSSFVAEYCHEGCDLICRGVTWRVVSVDEDRVYVELSENPIAPIPSWEGELIPVSYEVAREAIDLLSKGEFDPASITSEFAERFSEFVREQRKFFVPKHNEAFLEYWNGHTILHSFLGSRGNNALAYSIAAGLHAFFGIETRPRVTPYAIVFDATLEPSVLVQVAKFLCRREEIFLEYLERSYLFKRAFLNVAQRFGVIKRGVELDRVSMRKLISLYRNSPLYRETVKELMDTKFDLGLARNVLGDLASGRMKLVVVPPLSPLASMVVKGISEFEVEMRKKESIELFKRRLEERSIRLLCMNCGKYSVEKKLKDIEAFPQCPMCSSRLIAAFRGEREKMRKLVEKRLAGRSLTKEEEKIYDAIRRSADLVITYGKDAVYALATHGIGPAVAARILAKRKKGKEFFLELLRAERKYVSTRKYWKVS